MIQRVRRRGRLWPGVPVDRKAPWPRPARRLGLTIGLSIILVGMSAGCATDSEASVKPARAKPVDIDDVAFVRATVEEYSDGLPVVSYAGGEYRAKLEYARVFVDDCSTGYSRMLETGRDLLPVGTEIWAVRSQPIVVASDWISAEEVVSLVSAFIVPFGGEPEPPLGKSTINEDLVAETVALPDPYVPVTASPATSRTVRDVRRSMSQHDFAYWSRFQAAYSKNWDERVGVVGRCRAEWEEQRARVARARREADADLRRWQRERRALRHSGSTSAGRSCDGDGDGICNE